MKLIDRKCRDGAMVSRLKATRAGELLKQLPRSWKLNGKEHLERLYTFEDFAQTTGVCEKGRGCRRGPGPSSRSLSGLGEVQDRNPVAQE